MTASAVVSWSWVAHSSGQLQHLGADALVVVDQGGRRGHARLRHEAGRAQDGVSGVVVPDLGRRPVRGLDVRAGVGQEADRAEVQERRRPLGAHPLGGGRAAS